jgi:predicted amidophosphoribosyltransferase
VTGVAAALTDLVLPRTCAGCGLPGSVLCAGCCAWLAVPSVAAPRRVPWDFPPTVAAGPYAGPVRPAVVAFKDRGRAELVAPLGVALALAVTALLAAAGEPGAVLVPVPSSPAALRARGRDHVRELARRAVDELRAEGIGAEVARVLVRRGRVRDSAGLAAHERRANLAGSFAVRGRPPSGLLVVVDDVVTSGATLAEAAAALATARPEGDPVVAAVVAATPRRVADASSVGHLGVRRDGSVKTPDRLSDRRATD